MNFTQHEATQFANAFSTKQSKVFNKLQKQPLYPEKASKSNYYNVTNEPLPTFIHSQVAFQTWILYLLNYGVPNLPPWTLEEQELFKDLYFHYTNFSYNKE